MAAKFFTNINLNKNQLVSAAIENNTSDPSSPAVGQIYFDTNSSSSTYRRLRIYDGSSFVSIPYSGDIKNADITNSTIQIGKIDTSSVTLSSVGSPSASVGFNNKSQTSVGSIGMTTSGGATGKITNLQDPSDDTDAANKRYVDAAVTGLNVHGPAYVATTGVLGTPSTAYTAGPGSPVGVGSYLTVPAVTSTLSIDGVTLTASDVGKRILVKNQGASYLLQNGVYTLTSFPTTSTAKLTRAIDYDNSVSGEVAEGDYILVTNGTANTGKSYVQSSTGVITVGVSEISFTQFSSVVSYTAGNGVQLGGTGGTEFSIDTTITVDKTTNQSLTNKKINNVTITDAGSGTTTLTLANGSTLATSGGNSVTLTSTGTTNVTLPSGTKTLVATDGSITGSAGSVANALTFGTTGLKATVGSTPWSGSAAATIDIDTNKVPTISGATTVSFTASGATSLTLPTSGTVATTSSKLSAFASTTSSELAGTISDETGTGVLVFGTSPTFTTSIKLNGSSSGVTTVQATDAVTKTITLPANTGTLVGSGDTGTVSNTMLAGSIDLTSKVTGSLLVANGGTGGTSAATGRQGLGATGYYSSATHSSGTTITISAATHGLSADGIFVVQVFEVSSGDVVYPDININTSTGAVVVTFATSQSANTYRVTIIGKS